MMSGCARGGGSETVRRELWFADDGDCAAVLRIPVVKSNVSIYNTVDTRPFKIGGTNLIFVTKAYSFLQVQKNQWDMYSRHLILLLSMYRYHTNVSAVAW